MKKNQLKNVAKLATSGNPRQAGEDSGLLADSGLADSGLADSGLFLDGSGLFPVFLLEGEETFVRGHFADFDITLGWNSGSLLQPPTIKTATIEFRSINPSGRYAFVEDSQAIQTTGWQGILSINFNYGFTLYDKQTGKNIVFSEADNYTIPPRYLLPQE